MHVPLSPWQLKLLLVGELEALEKLVRWVARRENVYVI